MQKIMLNYSPVGTKSTHTHMRSHESKFDKQVCTPSIFHFDYKWIKGSLG
jgi:hypothetical protein